LRGRFREEITPVLVEGKNGAQAMEIDEQPLKAKLDKIASLKPAFRKDGTVTAANSSSISDGAAALVLMTASEAARRGPAAGPLVAHATHAQEPGLFTTAPVGAMRKLLAKTGWTVADVDLFEINEAFAVVTMAAMQDLGLPHDKVNVHGGACALGHPIGASGARVMVTLLSARQHGGKRGVASLCIGGGEATAGGAGTAVRRNVVASPGRKVRADYCHGLLGWSCQASRRSAARDDCDLSPARWRNMVWSTGEPGCFWADHPGNNESGSRPCAGAEAISRLARRSGWAIGCSSEQATAHRQVLLIQRVSGVAERIPQQQQQWYAA
jgi:hypothetical protein